MKEKKIREFLKNYFELEKRDTEINQSLINNLPDVVTWIFDRASDYYNWFMLICPSTLKTEIDYFIFEGWVVTYNTESNEVTEFDLEDRDVDTFIKFIKHTYPSLLN